MNNVAIYCDSQNVPLSPESANLLLTFAQGKGNVKQKNLYYNSEFANQVKVKETFSSTFNCVNVPCYNKDSADHCLITNVYRDVNSDFRPNVVILVSGDGGFAFLKKDFKSKEIKFIVIANKGNVKQELIENADELYFIEQLPNLVNNLTEKEPNLSKDYITFEEAIAYLIETIKTAVQKGKQTHLSLIASLMCQLFPNYQGVKSIRKPDGTRFKQFKQFIESVEKEGKVRRKNEELILA